MVVFRKLQVFHILSTALLLHSISKWSRIPSMLSQLEGTTKDLNRQVAKVSIAPPDVAVPIHLTIKNANVSSKLEGKEFQQNAAYFDSATELDIKSQASKARHGKAKAAKQTKANQSPQVLNPKPQRKLGKAVQFKPYLTAVCLCMLAAPLWCGLGCCSWTVMVIKSSEKISLYTISSCTCYQRKGIDSW